MNYTPEETKSLYQAFCQIEDVRKKRGVRYPLAVILTVVTLGKLCGESTLRGIAQWAQYRHQDLCATFGLKGQAMPHWTTYSRVLKKVDESQLQAAIQMGFPAVVTGGQLIIDGKTLRGSIATGQTQGEHLLAVYEPISRRVLAQESVGHKENEIGVAPQVLKQVALQAKVVTGDALFTQRLLSQQIIEAEGDYLWIVKDNQATLRTMIECLFRPQAVRPGHGKMPSDFQTATTVNRRHGRLERRTLTTSSLLNDYCDWPGLCQVFRLERWRKFKTAAATAEVVYGITSLSRLDATPTRLLALLRTHWAIENQLHYVRDVSLHEDACRLVSRTAQRCMATLNNFIIALLPSTPFSFLPDAQRFFNAHLSAALALLL